MAGFTSLKDVYDFVLERAGGCCTPDSVENVIVEALYDIRKSLGTAEYEVDGEITTVASTASYSVPAGIYYPKSLWQDNCVMDRGTAACTCGGLVEHEAKPDRWEWRGDGSVILHPTPDGVYTVKVRGLSAQGYTLKSGDTWLAVSTVLPNSDLGPVLARWATALALLDSDQNRASTYMTLAQTSLENWKERKVGDPSARFVMSGGRSHCRDGYSDIERFVIR